MIDTANLENKREQIQSAADIEAEDDERIARNQVLQKPKLQSKRMLFEKVPQKWEKHPTDELRRDGPTDTDEAWEHFEKRGIRMNSKKVRQGG